MVLDSTEQLALGNKYNNLKQWTKEFNEVSTQRDRLLATKEIVLEQYALQKENSDTAVKPENFKLLKPTWKFEEDPAYIERHRQITILGNKLKFMEQETQLKQFEANEKTLNSQYNDLKVRLDKLNAEIAEMESRK